MKPAPSALVAYLNNARSSPDVPLIMADVFTFTLLSGTILCYTNVDVTFSLQRQNVSRPIPSESTA